MLVIIGGHSYSHNYYELSTLFIEYTKSRFRIILTIIIDKMAILWIIGNSIRPQCKMLISNKDHYFFFCFSIWYFLVFCTNQNFKFYNICLYLYAKIGGTRIYPQVTDRIPNPLNCNRLLLPVDSLTPLVFQVMPGYNP